MSLVPAAVVVAVPRVVRWIDAITPVSAPKRSSSATVLSLCDRARGGGESAPTAEP